MSGPAPGADRLRALERRIVRRLDARIAARRVWESLPAIAQILVGVAASYALAHGGLGHAFPVLAITVVVNSLGFARDARPRRVLENVLAILVGVALSDGLTMLVGKGLWQLLVVMLVAFVVARAVSPNPAFAIGTAIPAALVVLLPDPEGGPFTRTLDGAVGGAIALLVTALVPRDPRGAAVREGRRLLAVIDEALGSIVDALRDADPAAGELALARLRRTQPLVDAWALAIESATAVARVSPFLRRHLPSLERHSGVQRGADLATRHLRTLARRVGFLVRDGEPRPALAAVLEDARRALHALGAEVGARSVEELELAGSARGTLVDLARRLDPATIVPGAGLADAAIVLLVRPLVVDLLVASGASLDEARSHLPPL